MSSSSDSKATGFEHSTEAEINLPNLLEAHVTYKEQSQQQVKLFRTTTTKDAEVIAETRIVRQSSPASVQTQIFMQIYIPSTLNLHPNPLPPQSL